jgi:hypothetical protein
MVWKRWWLYDIWYILVCQYVSQWAVEALNLWRCRQLKLAKRNICESQEKKVTALYYNQIVQIVLKD